MQNSIEGGLDSLVKCNIDVLLVENLKLKAVVLGEFFDYIHAVLELSLNNPPIWMAVGYLEIIHVKWYLKSVVIRQLSYVFLVIKNVVLTTLP